MDDRLNSSCLVADRLFRPEHKSKLPANRELDPCTDRNRDHTRHIGRSGCRKLLKQPGAQSADFGSDSFNGSAQS